MTNYVSSCFWDDCGTIGAITSKSNLLIELYHIISSDEVIMGHINTRDSDSLPSVYSLFQLRDERDLGTGLECISCVLPLWGHSFGSGKQRCGTGLGPYQQVCSILI